MSAEGYRDLSKQDKCKIRYLAGWTVLKVISYSNNYRKKFGGSKCHKVEQRIEKEKAIVDLANCLTASRSDTIEKTVVSESLEEIEGKKRGGLTHVCDEAYFFFVKLELSCRKYFTEEMIGKYKWDILKVVKQLVRQDPDVKLEWQCLLKRLSGRLFVIKSVKNIRKRSSLRFQIS